ncbi:MAG: hypothetical protein LC664_00715 [Flavobacteriales bacterium]|nr:hypothetical protein [Flavobacteriales bacterium]
MEKPRVLILGKLPPPIMGPAIATEIILNSELKDDYELFHFDTRINDSVQEMGKVKFSKIAQISRLYQTYRQTLREVKPHLVLVPIGQTSAGFFKDIPFIRLAAKSRIKVVVQLRGSAFKTWFDGLDSLFTASPTGATFNFRRERTEHFALFIWQISFRGRGCWNCCRL